MRKYIIAIILMAVGGVFLSLYLIPGNQEVTAMRARDAARPDAAGVDYAARYEAGDRSGDTLAGYTYQLIAQDNGAQMLPELEAYVAANPQDLKARKALAELYRLQGNDAAYVQQLEYVVEQEPSEQNLKLLADTYNYVQRYREQGETLRRLIDVSNGNEPEYYADLAIILALQERRGEAAGVVQELKSRHPEYVSFKLTQLVVGAAVDSGDMQKAFQEASSWSAQHPNAAEIANLADRLNYGGRPDLALQLIGPHRDQVTADDDLYLSYVNAAINDGQAEDVYQLMLASHQQSRLPAKLYRPLIGLALEREEIALAEQVASQLRRDVVEEEQAANLLELAHEKRAYTVSATLIALFGDALYLQDKPALAAIIALTRRDVDEDAKIQTALDAPLTRSARIYLARACARNHKEACFSTLAQSFKPYEALSPRGVNEVADLYISVQREDEIAADIESLAQARTDEEALQLARIKIAAAQNDRDRLVHWLNRQGATASTTTLAELFFLANDRGHGASAAEVAAVLYQRDPSPKHRDYVISSYIRAGLEARALPLIRQARDESRAAEDNYLAALVKLGKADATYRQELRDYVVPQLNDAQLDAERKLQLVYTLINTGNKQHAIPYIDHFAKSEGGQWRTLYNQVHAVAGKGGGAIPVTERSRDFRVALARDVRTSAKTKRMLAFSLLDDGHKQDATNIFFDLAQTASPDSQDMQDLLYLWGPRLNQEQLNWLMLRAQQAEHAGDKVRWGELIANNGDDFALMQYVTATPQALDHPSIRRRYFMAMGRYATEDTYKVGLRPWVDASENTAALLDYSDAAIASGYPEAAIYALQHAEKLSPKDEKMLKNLAILMHGRANYTQSQHYINSYAEVVALEGESETSPYEILFYQGEILRRENEMAQATQYYEQLIALGPEQATDLPRQSMYYTSLYYAGYDEQARQGFDGLLEAYPQDKGLLGDFLSALIEKGHLDEARSVASQYGQSAPLETVSAQALHINAPGIVGVQSGESGQELRIAFDAPLQEDWVPTGESQPAWVESVEQGYDSVVVAAKPGHELRFKPMSEDGIAVVAANGAVMSPEERLSRQQDLRLQLLYARLELESGDEQQALQRVQHVQQYFPHDPQLIGYTANLENAAGNWPRAIALLDQAQDLSPDNEDFSRMRRVIERQYADEIKADHVYRRIGNNDEHITTLSARVRPTYETEIGIKLQNDELDASQVRRSGSGQIGDFSLSRQQAELYAAYYFGKGDRVKGAVFANTDTAGVGAYYAFNNALGRTELIAEYQKPYWDFVEAVSENANRSRIGATHFANLNPRTSVGGEVSANQYNIQLDDDVAQTILVRANITHRIRDQHPMVAVSYGFDGEYLTDEQKRTAANGDVYRSLPLISREIHFPSVVVAEDLTHSTRGELVAGWAFDRLGEDGPQVQAKLTQDITDDVEAQLRASYGLQTNDTDQNATHLGGHLRYKF